jgi:alginate O-acetyltransferase complex protein AlgI
MLFNSFSYMMLFVPCVVLMCVGARKWRGPTTAQACVLLSSLFFYGWWNPSNLFYLAGSISVNWLISRSMGKASVRGRRRCLVLGLVLNVGFLCLFKYAHFLLGIFSHFPGKESYSWDFALPLGISFFTLMQVMYLIDCYEEVLPPLSLFDHATFVSFFPYVVSGPIARAKRMSHQFADFGGTTGDRSGLMMRGLFLFAIGLFKKVVFADAFASVANLGFRIGSRYSALEAWTFSIAYTLQIYFDFSGYSDMAIGSALMLGIELPHNFDAPLRSTSITEFWKRWHITLSGFITTYLYTPILKLFRRATLATATIATMTAMAIAGLWHGPSWNYVLFGGLHGAGLVTNLYWRKKKMPKLPAFASWLLTFMLVNVAFIFFRSRTMHDGVQMMTSLVNPHRGMALGVLDAGRNSFTGRQGIALAVGFVVAFYGKASDQLAREFKPRYWNSFAVAGMLVACWLSMTFNAAQEFVYFKF